MTLLYGLQNYGALYANTRHNMGALFVNSIKETLPFGPYDYGVKMNEGFMNDAGKGLGLEYHSTCTEVILCHDDLDIPFGLFQRISGKEFPYQGRHKGVKSCLGELGDVPYARLAFGIGPIPNGLSRVEYVLSEFTPEEQEALPLMFRLAARLL